MKQRNTFELFCFNFIDSQLSNYNILHLFILKLHTDILSGTDESHIRKQNEPHKPMPSSSAWYRKKIKHKEIILKSQEELLMWHTALSLDVFYH